MIARKGITVVLIRASDGQEFDEFKLTKFVRYDRLNSQAIVVREGDLFFPRIKVAGDFAWYQANVLEVMVNFDNAHPSARGHNTSFIYPRIPKPKDPETIVIDLVKCPIMHNGTFDIKEFSTKFVLNKVMYQQRSRRTHLTDSD